MNMCEWMAEQEVCGIVKKQEQEVVTRPDRIRLEKRRHKEEYRIKTIDNSN